MTKFSHITITDNVSDTLTKSLCGAYVSGTNLRAIYFDGNKYAHPLCAKCAALRVIAETTATAK